MSRNRERLDASQGTFLTHHVVVPAAVITMVASLLFFLVDLRSAFLGGGRSLKWVGVCFVVATVLNERYGRSAGGEAFLQRFFTLSLAGATTLVLLLAPWETPPGGLGEKLANLLILAVVWHFATRVTRELSPEDGRSIQREASERDLLLFQPWTSDDKGAESLPGPQEALPAEPRNPAVTVARLAAVALLAFALGEPVVLGAAPQTGPKALGAVVVFLFSTGIVLAAGSALDTLRRAETAGGRVASGVVPGRMALAALLLAGVLAAALALPGLSFRGTGRLRPPVAHEEGLEQEHGYQETDNPGQPGYSTPGEVTGSHLRSDRNDPSQGPSSEATFQKPDQNPPELPKPASAPAAGLDWLAMAGKWLLIPLVLAPAALGIWGLLRRMSRWPGRGARKSGRWWSLLGRLAGLWPRPRRRDPLAGLEDLSERPAREAVLAAYHRFLVLLESLGHARPTWATPYETLQGLPPHLQPLERPARTLTDLYILAAYAAEPVERGDRERAITILREMRGLVERPAPG